MFEVINEQFVLHWNSHWPISEGTCYDLKMYQPIVTKTIVTLKEIMVTKDYCYTLPWGNRNSQITTQRHDWTR